MAIATPARLAFFNKDIVIVPLTWILFLVEYINDLYQYDDKYIWLVCI